MISTSRPLELLHFDLFGHISPLSLGGKAYFFVIVDDYSRFTWTLFLTRKDEAFNMFVSLCRKIQNKKGHVISTIRSDHGRECENRRFEEFCNTHGITDSFSAPRTLQQNGVVERKNRALQEMTSTMLNEHKLPKYFWVDAVNTSTYVLN